MSRIGNKPIVIPAKVTVTVDAQTVAVQGPKAKLAHELPALIGAQVADQKLVVSRADDSRQAKSLHGLSRSLLHNMMLGVTAGFHKELEIVGVGYRAQVNGQTVVLNVGLSYPIEFAIPEGITVTVTDNTKVRVEGADKQVVGQVAATLRSFRPPEPYNGKGIRYAGEHITMKQGKTV